MAGISNGGVFQGHTLYQVNTGTGTLTSVGTTTITYDAFGSTLTGMFAIDTSFNLYSVSTAGATTLIGPTGVTLSALWGMSDNSATLYLSNGTNLYSVNTASGHATLVGGLTGGQEVGAMLFSGGTLYGGVDSPGLTIDTINAGTGAATFLNNLNPTGDGNFWGLAPGPAVVGAVPEPNSSWLLLSGLAVVGWRKVKAIRR